jgi:hypothetical protein
MKIQRRFAPTGGLIKPESVACFPGMRNKTIWESRALKLQCLWFPR